MPRISDLLFVARDQASPQIETLQALYNSLRGVMSAPIIGRAQVVGARQAEAELNRLLQANARFQQSASGLFLPPGVAPRGPGAPQLGVAPRPPLSTAPTPFENQQLLKLSEIAKDTRGTLSLTGRQVQAEQNFHRAVLGGPGVPPGGGPPSGGLAGNFFGGFFGRGFAGEGDFGDFSNFALTVGSLSRYFLITTTLVGLIRALGDTATEVVNLDRELVDLNVALGDAGPASEQMVGGLTRIARLVGDNVSTAVETATVGIRTFANDGTESLEEMERAGLRFAASVQQLAVITDKGLADVRGDVTAIASSFDLNVGQLPAINEVIANAKSLGGVPGEVSQGLAASATALEEAGFGLAESASILSLVTRQTDQSGRAVATRLSRIVNIIRGAGAQAAIADVGIDIAQPIADQVRQLANLRIPDSQREALFARLAGTANIREFQALIEGMADIQNNANRAFDEGGRASDEYQKNLNSLAGVIKQIIGDLTALQTGVGRSGAFDFIAASIRVLEPVLKTASDLLNVYNEIPRPLRTTIALLGQLIILERLLTAAAARRAEVQAAAGVTGAAGAAGGGFGFFGPVTRRGVGFDAGVNRFRDQSGRFVAASAAQASGARGAFLSLGNGLGRLKESLIGPLGVVVAVAAVTTVFQKMSAAATELDQAAEEGEAALASIGEGLTDVGLEAAVLQLQNAVDRTKDALGIAGGAFDGFWGRAALGFGFGGADDILDIPGLRDAAIAATGGTRQERIGLFSSRQREGAVASEAEQVGAATRILEQTIGEIEGIRRRLRALDSVRIEDPFSGALTSVEQLTSGLDLMEAQGVESKVQLDQLSAAIAAMGQVAGVSARNLAGLATELPQEALLEVLTARFRGEDVDEDEARRLAAERINELDVFEGFFAVALQTAILTAIENAAEGDGIVDPSELSGIVEAAAANLAGNFDDDTRAEFATTFERILRDQIEQTFTPISIFLEGAREALRLAEERASTLETRGDPTAAAQVRVDKPLELLNQALEQGFGAPEFIINALYDGVRAQVELIAGEEGDVVAVANRLLAGTTQQANQAQRIIENTAEVSVAAAERLSAIPPLLLAQLAGGIQAIIDRIAALQTRVRQTLSRSAFEELQQQQGLLDSLIGGFGGGTDIDFVDRITQPLLSSGGGGGGETALERLVARLRASVDPRDIVGNAVVDLKIARARLADAAQGSSDYYNALREVAEAELALAEARREQSDALRFVNFDPISKVNQAKIALEDARNILQGALPGTAAWAKAFMDLVSAQVAYADALRQARLSARLVAGDITDPVFEAAEQARAAREALRAAQRRGAASDVVDALQLDVQRAEAQEEAARVQQLLRDLQVASDLGRITHAQRLAVLEEERARLLAINDRTRQQQELLDQIELAIKAANEELTGQFNIGDIRVPTVFEVRRAVAGLSQAALGGGGGALTPGSFGATSIDNSSSQINVYGASLSDVIAVVEEMLGLGSTGRTGVVVSRRI